MRLWRLVNAVRASLPRTIPLLRDARVPLALKLVSGALAVLIVSPIDIFGDVPFLGALDDAALMALLCVWFVRMAAKYIEPIRVRPTNSTNSAPGAALAVR